MFASGTFLLCLFVWLAFLLFGSLCVVALRSLCFLFLSGFLPHYAKKEKPLLEKAKVAKRVRHTHKPKTKKNQPWGIGALVQSVFDLSLGLFQCLERIASIFVWTMYFSLLVTEPFKTKIAISTLIVT
eukprot:m.80334 g.80334  ORF g.80334 m.80334 type:complete len:128 (-) comp14205_c0_seq1:650-1033(-)